MEEYVNRFYCQDSRNLSFIPDGVVDLVVTSPMYRGAKMPYDVASDELTAEEYEALHRKVWAECYRVMKPGARICVNVANADRKPYIRLNAMHAEWLKDAGFEDRGEIIWNKPGASKRGSTAWGTWKSPRNPSLRDQHEYVLIFSKGYESHVGDPAGITITTQEFMDYTMSVWDINPAFASKKGHPAPFPPDLPGRLIKLYTYRNDLVLDPFMGSGTTCQVAELLGRRWIGVDLSPSYCDLARQTMEATSRRFDLYSVIEETAAASSGKGE